MSKHRISLGDQVKDKVTGFKGIVTATTLFLNGCVRCAVQPPMGKDGKIPDSQYFDEPQLEILKKAKVKAENTTLHEDAAEARVKTGGPSFKGPARMTVPRR